MTYDKKVFFALQELLLSLDVEMWRAQFLARRMVRSFGEQSYLVLGAFRAAGWTFEEVYLMDQVSNQWRNAPQNILLLERLLRVIGLPKPHARRMAMESRLYSCQDFSEILLKVLAFRAVGISDGQIFKIAGHKPALFLTPMKSLEDWLAEMRLRKIEPRFCIQYLKPPRVESKLAPSPIPEYWQEFDLRTQTGEAQLAVIPTIVFPEPPTEKPKEAMVEAVVAEPEPPPPAPVPMVETDTPLGGPETHDFKKVCTPEPAETAPEPEPAPILAPTPLPPVMKPEIQKLPPLMTFKAFPSSLVPAVPIPATPPIAPKPAAVVAEDSPTEHDMISELYHLVFELIKLHDPEWLEQNRQAFIEANPWLDDTSSPTWEIIRIFKSWFDLRVSMAQTDPRLKFVVCILRNQNLPAKKRLGVLRIKRAVLKRRSDPFAREELKVLDQAIAHCQGLIDPEGHIAEYEKRIAEIERWNKRNAKKAGKVREAKRFRKELASLRERIVKTRRYGHPRAFIALEPEIAYLRLYTARSILEFDASGKNSRLLRHPEFLLQPFEDTNYGGDQGMRGFSVPPPAVLDMKAIQAKCTELRFRANELRRFTDVPWKKPYVNMVLEPSRSRFLDRLQAYLQKLGDEARLPSASRHKHRDKTAYSSLA